MIHTIQEETCYGCKHLTSSYFCDGTTYYGCDMHGGIVTGEHGMDCDDDPIRCKQYET